jgi:hypothetical protein
MNVSSQYFGEIVVTGGFDTCPPEGTPGQVWRAVPGYGGGITPPPTQPPIIEMIHMNG